MIKKSKNVIDYLSNRDIESLYKIAKEHSEKRKFREIVEKAERKYEAWPEWKKNMNLQADSLRENDGEKEMGVRNEAKANQLFVDQVFGKNSEVVADSKPKEQKDGQSKKRLVFEFHESAVENEDAFVKCLEEAIKVRVEKASFSKEDVIEKLYKKTFGEVFVIDSKDNANQIARAVYSGLKEVGDQFNGPLIDDILKELVYINECDNAIKEMQKWAELGTYVGFGKHKKEAN